MRFYFSDYGGRRRSDFRDSEASKSIRRKKRLWQRRSFVLWVTSCTAGEKVSGDEVSEPKDQGEAMNHSMNSADRKVLLRA